MKHTEIYQPNTKSSQISHRIRVISAFDYEASASVTSPLPGCESHVSECKSSSYTGNFKGYTKPYKALEAPQKIYMRLHIAT